VIFDILMQLYMLNTYDTLYRYTGNPPELRTWLAESHTVSDDALRWTFTLRGGIKFHDGTTMTAEDVVYSFQRVLALKRGPASAFVSYLKPENVKALDEGGGVCVVDGRGGGWGAAVGRVGGGGG
ncbi:ABC transporter substrate-binding protein, partial [Rhizobiaceae sp. 2RAB30]